MKKSIHFGVQLRGAENVSLDAYSATRDCP
jgi:hypothetical protein